MAENEKVDFENLEEAVFKALDHQTRRDVLRYVGESKSATFTDMLNALKITDSPSLAYHLKSLVPFIEQKEGKYRLTIIGKDAYNLLLKTHAYDKLALLQKKKTGVILGNAVIWLSAIAASVYIGVDTILSTITLPILATVSLVITYELFE